MRKQFPVIIQKLLLILALNWVIVTCSEDSNSNSKTYKFRLTLYSSRSRQYDAQMSDLCYKLLPERYWAAQIRFGQNLPTTLTTILDTRFDKSWVLKDLEPKQVYYYETCYQVNSQQTNNAKYKFIIENPNTNLILLSQGIDQFQSTCHEESICEKQTEIGPFNYRNIIAFGPEFLVKSPICETEDLNISHSVYFVNQSYQRLAYLQVSAALGFGVNSELIQVLSEQKKIEKKQVSVYFSQKESDADYSYLMIGGFEVSKLRDPQSMYTFQQWEDQKMNWRLYGLDMSFGWFKTGIKAIVFDASTIFLEIPQQFFMRLAHEYAQTIGQITWKNDANPYMLIDCESRHLVPDITIQVRDIDQNLVPIKIPSEMFVQEMEEESTSDEGSENTKQKCEILLRKIDAREDLDTVVLGVPFMKMYVTIFDYDTRQVKISEAKP